MKRLLLVTFLICLLVGQYARAAENKDFYSIGTIITGQTWYNVGIYDTTPAHTTVTMTGGLVHSLSAYDSSSLIMSGGHIDFLDASANSTLTLSATATVGTTHILGSGVFNMIGGTIAEFSAIQQAVVNLRGGGIMDMLISRDSSFVNVFGTNLAKTSSGGPFGYGRITGLWQDNSPFTINLGDSGTYSHVNLVTIPEPVTLLLFGAGIPLVRRFGKHI
jgi:hypothetical protein